MKTEISAVSARNHGAWNSRASKRDVLKVALLVNSCKVIEKHKLTMTAPRTRKLGSSFLKLSDNAILNAAHVADICGWNPVVVSSPNDLALAQRGLGRSVDEGKEGSSHE
jgi:hypothetical protein